jgi:hypothetical protein
MKKPAIPLNFQLSADRMDQIRLRHRYVMRIMAVVTKLQVHSKLKTGECA